MTKPLVPFWSNKRTISFYICAHSSTGQSVGLRNLLACLCSLARFAVGKTCVFAQWLRSPKIFQFSGSPQNLWFLFGLTKERYHIYLRPQLNWIERWSTEPKVGSSNLFGRTKKNSVEPIEICGFAEFFIYLSYLSVPFVAPIVAMFGCRCKWKKLLEQKQAGSKNSRLFSSQ